MMTAHIEITGASSTFAPPSMRPANGRRAGSDKSFASDLKAAENQAQLRDAAAKLVASALVLPALESMHDSPFRAGGAFAAGPAEKRFAPLLDEQFADRVTKASNFALVDAIVERFSASEGIRMKETINARA